MLGGLVYVCYFLPDLSHFKIEALRAGINFEIMEVSENLATHNTADVVRLSALIYT